MNPKGRESGVDMQASSRHPRSYIPTTLLAKIPGDPGSTVCQRDSQATDVTNYV